MYCDCDTDSVPPLAPVPCETGTYSTEGAVRCLPCQAGYLCPQVGFVTNTYLLSLYCLLLKLEVSTWIQIGNDRIVG